MVGMSWAGMIRDGLAMRHGRELTMAQVIMAANTPMLLRSGLVEGRTDAGVLAAGQVVGMLGGAPEELPTVADVITGVVEQAVDIIEGLGTLLTQP
jgi:tRNA U38,U39,U40 pseudouridine synthase TruA